MQGSIKVYVPTGELALPSGSLAERPESLVGLRLGLLDNGKEFSEVVLGAVADDSKRELGNLRIRFWRKGFPAKAAPFIEEMAAESDIVINGVGH